MSLLQLLSTTFVQNAFYAVTAVSIAAGAVGYFVVLRRQAFAAHAIGHVGFAGAAGAVLLGLSPIVGLLVFCLGAGVLIGVGGAALDDRDAVVGVTLTAALGLGVLFISLYSGYANATYTILFGQILGVSNDDVLLVALLSLAVVVAVSLTYRPMLFVSVDAQSAESRGVSVRAMSLVFMALLALTTVVAIQVVGVLLVFSLLVAPAAAAEVLTNRPWPAMALSMGLALSSAWLGLLLGVWLGGPVSFWITALASSAYLYARVRAAIAARSQAAAHA
ncbi:MAG TPA: metal ABC transporter permease [Acidimicrobiales bacterium]|nr:metal ABC transporter permease [Acidimicrobiales bacterium]